MEATADSGLMCSNKLCKAEATQAIEVRSAWLRDRGTEVACPRFYALCDKHYATYLPRGEGYMDRTNATRLRVQCKPAKRVTEPTRAAA